MTNENCNNCYYKDLDGNDFPCNECGVIHTLDSHWRSTWEVVEDD